MTKADRIRELVAEGVARADIVKEVHCSQQYVSMALKRGAAKAATKSASLPAASVQLNLQTGVAQIDCEDESAGIDAHIIARVGPEFKALLESLAKLC